MENKIGEIRVRIDRDIRLITATIELVNAGIAKGLLRLPKDVQLVFVETGVKTKGGKFDDRCKAAEMVAWLPVRFERVIGADRSRPVIGGDPRGSRPTGLRGIAFR